MNGFDRDGPARWLLGGCFAIFMVPFFIAGVFVLQGGIRGLNRGSSGALFLVLVGLLFTAFAASIVAFIFAGLRNAQAISRRMDAHPAQPWLWRDDWSERRVREAAATQGIVLFAFALMWNAVTLPTTFVVGRRFPREPQAGVVLIFAAIGLVVFAAATYAALRRAKFGRSICEIDRVPIEPGQHLGGTIVHRGTQVPESGYRIVLSCIHRIVTGGGRDRSVTDDVLWSREQKISGALAAPSPLGMRVPFAFDVPGDAPSSDFAQPRETVLWQLAATAALPGIDYSATFELPVFATAGDAAAHHAMRREAAASRELPPSSRVSVAPLPSGGIELRVSPLRDARAFFVFFMFAAIWFGAIALMWRLGTPRAIAGVFSLFGLFILAVAIDFFGGTWAVTADRGSIAVQHAIAGMATTKSLDASQITSIDSKVGGHVGKHPYFDVAARLRDGSSRTLARYLESRSDADTVAAKLWAALRG